VRLPASRSIPKQAGQLAAESRQHRFAIERNLDQDRAPVGPMRVSDPSVRVEPPHELHARFQPLGDLCARFTGPIIRRKDFGDEIGRHRGVPAPCDSGETLVAKECQIGRADGLRVRRDLEPGVLDGRAPVPSTFRVCRCARAARPSRSPRLEVRCRRSRRNLRVQGGGGDKHGHRVQHAVVCD
jgi:hypothetical protein